MDHLLHPNLTSEARLDVTPPAAGWRFLSFRVLALQNGKNASPLPAERLILYEVYVPGGMWAGWPPHCHDGYAGSPDLEEIYYYRIDPPDGFALHRNYRRDIDFDETWPAQDGDLVLVPQGFHPVAVQPGCNAYFLNYLAGELLDEARATPPLDDSHYAWMKQDWDGRRLRLPIG